MEISVQRIGVRIQTEKVLLLVGAVILTILCFLVFVETSYLKWHSGWRMLFRYLIMAVLSNSGVYLSLTPVGQKFRYVTGVLAFVGMVAVSVTVVYWHSLLGAASVLVFLWTMIRLWAKRA